MKPLSANAAAKTAGKAKATILEAIEKGELSATKNNRGHWQIDPSELSRVFDFKPSDQSHDQSPKPTPTTQDQTENRIRIAELEAEVKALRGQIERTDTDREREREQLSKHIDDLRSSMAALTDQRAGQGGKRKLLGIIPISA